MTNNKPNQLSFEDFKNVHTEYIHPQHTNMENQASVSSHVVVIPSPMQGHVTPIFHLTGLLCLAKINVTFITTTYIYQRLKDSIEVRFSLYPGFHFEVVSDGLPDDHPRTGQDGCWAVQQGFCTAAEPLLRGMLSTDHSVTCLIVDGANFVHDLAQDVGIPVIEMRCFGASYDWVASFVSKLVHGTYPFPSWLKPRISQIRSEFRSKLLS